MCAQFLEYFLRVPCLIYLSSLAQMKDDDDGGPTGILHSCKEKKQGI